MASKNASFDIVSVIDLAEVKNAVNQAMMEIGQRFDFKGSCSEIKFDQKAEELTLTSEDEFKLKSVIDILHTKLIKRKVSIKALDYGTIESASGGKVRQVAKLQQGISQDKGREIVKFIKDLGIKKVQAQIMDDQLRVTGKDRDDLQSVIASLKEKDFSIDMSFTNYR
jgi:cyclic-di-GMP-binding protein